MTIKSLARMLTCWASRQAAMRQLNGLSDHQRADIGLCAERPLRRQDAAAFLDIHG